jgi:hypothetical protein
MWVVCTFSKLLLDWRDQGLGWARLMASWIRGLGSWGFCSEMRLLSLWRDCM